MFRHHQTALGCCLAVALILNPFGTPSAFTQERDLSQDFERCKVIANDPSRLECLRNLLPGASTRPATSAARDLWPLIRTPNPKGGREAISIMRTADTAQSDPDLAGLMIRCKEAPPGLEVVLALVRPFPPRAKRDVVVALGTVHSVLQAEASPAGTSLVLPLEATAFTTGPWRELKELTVTINDAEAKIRGVIPLDGLAPAMARLSASCPSG